MPRETTYVKINVGAPLNKGVVDVSSIRDYGSSAPTILQLYSLRFQPLLTGPPIWWAISYSRPALRFVRPLKTT